MKLAEDEAFREFVLTTIMFYVFGFYNRRLIFLTPDYVISRLRNPLLDAFCFVIYFNTVFFYVVTYCSF
jgi:hypothetical protein